MLDATQYQVLQILLSLQDNSGEFTSPVLHIERTIGGLSATITELPFDIEKKAIVYLENGGTYSVYVTSGSQTRAIGNLYIDNVNLQKTIVINSLIPTMTNTGNITYSLTMDNSTGVVTFTWYDPYNNTIWVNMSLYNESSGALVATFSAHNSNNVVFTYAGDVNTTYRADLSIKNNILSNHDWMFSLITSALVKIFPMLNPLVFPALPKTVLYWASFIGLLSIPMFFDERNGAIAGLVVALAGFTVAALGWWQIGFLVALSAIFLAGMNIYSSRRRDLD
jgi:hypothetical protein